VAPRRRPSWSSRFTKDTHAPGPRATVTRGDLAAWDAPPAPGGSWAPGSVVELKNTGKVTHEFLDAGQTRRSLPVETAEPGDVFAASSFSTPGGYLIRCAEVPPHRGLGHRRQSRPSSARSDEKGQLLDPRRAGTAKAILKVWTRGKWGVRKKRSTPPRRNRFLDQGVGAQGQRNQGQLGGVAGSAGSHGF